MRKLMLFLLAAVPLIVVPATMFTPVGIVPLAVMVLLFMLWTLWARVDHPVRRHIRALFPLLIAVTLITISPYIVVPAVAVKGLLVVFAGWWWVATLHYLTLPSLPRLRLRRDVVDEVEGDDEDEEEVASERVHEEAVIGKLGDPFQVGYGPQPAPGGNGEKVVVPVGYAKPPVPFTDPEEEDEEDFEDRLRGMWPDTRKTPTGRVHVKDVAAILSMSEEDVVTECRLRGIEIQRDMSAKKLVGGPGSTSRMAIMWASVDVD